MNDLRTELLAKLRAHEARGLDAHEAAMAAAMIAFVAENPRCAERTLAGGHLTGSAWIVGAARTRTLLTHHAKLGIWVQLGGHADGELDIAAVAMREAQEESGLTRLRLVTAEIFDVDRHWIPERKGEAGHWHYDVRFLIEADADEPLVITRESKDLRWVELARMRDFSSEESMLRMVRKTQTPHAGVRNDQ
jgi:8-oxo-dGTP pyrophosphatase MutT (NUDIX family)